MHMRTADILSERKEIWKTRAHLRRLYLKWCGHIAGALRPGKTLELGGGSGNLKEFFPEAISTDIVFASWLDAVMDAQAIPFRDGSLDNIILFDVLHHIESPVIFFSEAERLLRPGGRIVMMEPYVSPASFFAYQFLHAEGMNRHIDPLKRVFPKKDKEPFQGNQAIPSLIFGKYREKFKRRFPRLRIIQEELMDLLVYPLSGGFQHPCLSPMFLFGALDRLERLLLPLKRYLAFRMFVVIERD